MWKRSEGKSRKDRGPCNEFNFVIIRGNLNDLMASNRSSTLRFSRIIGVVTVARIHVLFEVCTVLFTKEKFEPGKCWVHHMGPP